MNISGQTLHRISHPKQFEDEFMAYLQKAGANLTQSKSISGIGFYQYQDVSLVKTKAFFDGAILQPNFTNLQSFQRGESEHTLITGIRISINTAVLDVAVPPIWSLGTTGSGVYENCTFTITNNNIIELKDFPLAEALSGLTTIDNGLIVLEQPILWLGQSPIKVEVESPVANFPASSSIKIELLGIGLV